VKISQSPKNKSWDKKIPRQKKIADDMLYYIMGFTMSRYLERFVIVDDDDFCEMLCENYEIPKSDFLKRLLLKCGKHL